MAMQRRPSGPMPMQNYPGDMEERTTFYRPQQESSASASGTVISIFDGNQRPIQIDLAKFGKSMITFGRGSENDIVLTSHIVSRKNHGCFLLQNGRVAVQDMDSANGILINGRYINQGYLNAGDMLRIDDGVSAIAEGVLILLNSGKNFSWKTCSLQNQPSFVIGRSKDCSLVLSHVGVSKYHAQIRMGGDGYYIQDLNSTNGVYVNGRRINGAVRLQERDLITITNTKIIYSSGLLYCCTYADGFGVEARHIVRTVGKGNRRFNICNDVSLSIKPGELVAIIGGSGAGKTTFMNAISGYNRPTSGQVLINGQELYQTYDSLKNIIGYVPQQDIVYDNLTLKAMLTYAAKLRLPDDTTPAERDERVAQVIHMVELDGKENTMIRKLSGGQKKRASIAVELLPDPKLFFLDEPASGLDPGTERNLMRTLKNMTQDGKTIILVTHSTLNLQDCDKIVFMGKGGNLCYFGNMKEAEKFFNVTNLVDVYNMITDHSIEWRRKYDSIAALQNEVLEKPREYREDKRKNRHSPIRQTGVLSARYLNLLVNDRQRLMLVLIQAPLLAFLISLVKDGDQFEYYSSTQSLLFALSCSAFWIGTLNAIQEICKERVVLHREYMTGLHLVPYILSKFIVLGLLCLVESVLLIGVFTLTVGAPDKGIIMNPVLEMFLSTFLTAFAASGMGLFASAMFKNPDRAMTVAPILLMPQILFSGLLFELKGATKIISWFAVCRWSMEAYGTTSNMNSLQAKTISVDMGGGIMQDIQPAVQVKDFFEYTAAHMSKAWLILLAFVIAFGVLSVLALQNIRKSE